ncbi:MAG: signal recognition particle-docking protein FtsY [Chloroflexi bacterium]|nr:MAG: signal recognition particle-docking protein FtsY [Phototrophicales bacterium]RMF81941.1 MAG: signal recognition particle-docking protein FtsY [Chloroflexota bacterium]
MCPYFLNIILFVREICASISAFGLCVKINLIHFVLRFLKDSCFGHSACVYFFVAQASTFDIFTGVYRLSIFRSGLAKTRQSFFGRISQILGNTEIDDEIWDDIEAILLQADLGVETTQRVIDDLKNRVRKQGLTSAEQLNTALRESLQDLMQRPPVLNISGRPLSVILVVGVNGSGKTTSIAKLAHRLKLAGRNVLIAAGDTFRAAAIEQLQTWGERVDVPVIAGQPGSDPAAVVYDATEAAKARGHDVLIIDTAGRLHTNYNLMEELAKIKKVSQKIVPDAPHEVLLVLDGTTGQNALQQAQKFREMVDVTGVIVTKLDSTAKGGMVFAVFNDLNLPIHYIGLGEGVNDLVDFQPEIFIKSLFEEN